MARYGPFEHPGRAEPETAKSQTIAHMQGILGFRLIDGRSRTRTWRRPPTGALQCPSSVPRIRRGRGTLLVMTSTRITVRPDQMDGVPCIRGLRIPVATVLGMIADGMSTDQVLDAYPDLEAADVQEAVRYAAEAVRERELPLAG
jgi:uncharacterized protein (DUF433 family)